MNLPIFPAVTRRDWLRSASCGFGSLALASLLTNERARAASPRSIAPHFTPKAKRFIFIYLQGAPSHLDTFDYKPKLVQDHDKLASPGGGDVSKYVGTPFKFERHGASGQWISELYPNLSMHADGLCFVKSMTTDVPNHSQAVLQMHTGSFRFPRPSVGACMTYGLGSEAEDLPGYLVLSPVSRDGEAQNYGSAFLPSRYQATRIGAEGQPIVSARLGGLSNPRWDEAGQAPAARPSERPGRRSAPCHGVRRRAQRGHPLLRAGIPDATRTTSADGPRSRDARTLELYGVGTRPTDDFGRQCLIARRAVESGVRFVEITSIGWDHHRDLKKRMSDSCAAIDRPVAGLLSDLKGARAARRHRGAFWGRIRSYPHEPRRKRPRPPIRRLHHVAGRRRRPRRHELRCHRRPRIDRCREKGPHPRPQRHPPPRRRARPHSVDLSLLRTRFPAHGRLRGGHYRHSRLSQVGAQGHFSLTPRSSDSNRSANCRTRAHLTRAFRGRSMPRHVYSASRRVPSPAAG